MLLPLPSEFVARLTTIHGEEGVVWLQQLPARLDAWRERFALCDCRPAPAMASSLVLFAETVTGESVVLKAGPDADRLAAEVETLRGFGVHRAVAVRDAWLEEGAVLLERAQPGVSLASHANEDEAMRVAAELIARRWPVAPAWSVAESAVEFGRALDRLLDRDSQTQCPLDLNQLRRARALFTELLEDAGEPVLLHGDLHYDNILSSDRAGYVLIDPKGVIGDPALDIGYLVSRPAPLARDALPLFQAIDRRLAFLPEATGQDPQRVAGFAYVTAALSAAWALEDRDEGWHAYAEVMDVLERR